MNKKIIITIFIIIILLFGLLSIPDFGFLVKYRINEYKIDKNPNKKVELVFTTDKNYADYLKVAIKSAIVNKNKDSFYNITIFCVDLDKKDFGKHNINYERDDVKINIIPLSLKMLEKLPDYKTDRSPASKADMFKFIMPEILKDIDKVLYIDSDTIIQKDLLKLYNTDISDNYLGAVVENKPKKYVLIKKIIGSFYYHKIIYKNIRYNNGVMLLNLKKMREDGISEKLINEKLKEPSGGLVTQDTFNTIIPVDKIKKLSPVYNIIIYQYYKREMDFKDVKMIYFPFCNKYKEIDELIKDAAIIHWCGREKPWLDNSASLGKVWVKYARMLNI